MAHVEDPGHVGQEGRQFDGRGLGCFGRDRRVVEDEPIGVVPDGGEHLVQAEATQFGDPPRHEALTHDVAVRDLTLEPHHVESGAGQRHRQRPAGDAPADDHHICSHGSPSDGARSACAAACLLPSARARRPPGWPPLAGVEVVGGSVCGGWPIFAPRGTKTGHVLPGPPVPAGLGAGRRAGCWAVGRAATPRPRPGPA